MARNKPSFLGPIHALFVPNRRRAFAPRTCSANADENHPNPEPLQDRFHMLRFELQSIRHSNDDLIVVRPRSSTSAAFAIRRSSVVMLLSSYISFALARSTTGPSARL